MVESYVRTIVERYKTSPNIFAWELANEARCGSDTLASGPACVPGTETLLKWYRQQSDFVRSLYVKTFVRNHVNADLQCRDPFHLITTGGEGHFFWKDPPK